MKPTSTKAVVADDGHVYWMDIRTVPRGGWWARERAYYRILRAPIELVREHRARKGFFPDLRTPGVEVVWRGGDFAPQQYGGRYGRFWAEMDARAMWNAYVPHGQPF